MPLPILLLRKRKLRHSLGRPSRSDFVQPDFILVDSSGFVDLLEIKKPNNQKVVSSTEYRNNYVAGRDLEGAIVQIEKYVYILNHEGEARAKKYEIKLQVIFRQD